MKSLLGNRSLLGDRDIYMPEQVIMADKPHDHTKAVLYGMAAFALVAYFIFKAK